MIQAKKTVQYIIWTLKDKKYLVWSDVCVSVCDFTVFAERSYIIVISSGFVSV